MKMRCALFFPILLFIWGCASHYYKSNEDSICIYLKKPEAKSVFFLHSIDGYKSHPAKKIDEKTWEVRIPTQREFKYFYIVDGMTFVPDCKYREGDDFGSDNCIYDPYL